MTKTLSQVEGINVSDFRAAEDRRYPGLKLFDAYQTKQAAKHDAEEFRRLGVQYVKTAKIRPPQGGGRLKWGVYLGGSNSAQYIG